MAKSNTHKFGQMIGDLLEEAVINKLSPIANEHEMYLDYKHPRKARNNNKEVIWIDGEGNKHKLDIVIECKGSETEIGDPKAFIEMAWRRYTKHSKNKAQEISGAVLPLIQKYKEFSPFYGVVLAGEFTRPSILQLESQGFKVLYFDFNTIIQGFNEIGLQIEWKEDTSEDQIGEYVEFFNSVSQEDKNKLVNYMFNTHEDKVNEFINSLKECFLRQIERIRIFTLYGEMVELESIDKAIEYINKYDEKNPTVDTLIGYEIYIRYSNGDKIEVDFKEKRDVLRFLNQL